MDRAKINDKQIELNKKLASLLTKYGIKNVRITSMGNSIGSGFSMVRTTKPLLLRNTTLSSILSDQNIELDVHHFARAQNNSDEHMVEWLEKNIKESEVHEMNRSDYSGEATSLPTHITKEELEEYYPINKVNDIGLKDSILEKDEELANIVIYNGATGSFLDGLTRHGTLKQQMIHGVKRDLSSIESVLKVIQINNREGKSDTQVYLCGAPNFLGLGISNIINKKIKKIADKYANVVYVEPIKSKMFYQKMDENGMDISGKGIDIHYDEKEYEAFNNNIISTINDNFEISKAMIELDRNFYNLNKDMELYNKDLVSNDEERKIIISKEIKSKAEKIKNQRQRFIFLKRLKKYVTERFPYDFVYLGKKQIYDPIKDERKKTK